MSERTSTWQQAKQSLTVRTAHGRRGQRESNNIFPGLASLSAFLWSTSVFSAPLGSVDLTALAFGVRVRSLRPATPPGHPGLSLTYDGWNDRKLQLQLQIRPPMGQ